MAEQQTPQSLAESLSALVDNQASELELQRILKASQTDIEVKATWARYQVISAGVRRDLPSFEMSDFAARVSAAIDAEPAASAVPESSQQQTSKPHWWQNVARFAVAASVAGGVVLFAQNPAVVNQPADLTADAQVVEPVAPAAIPSGYHGQALSLRTVGLQQGPEGRQQESRNLVFVPREAMAATANARPSLEAQEEVREYLMQLIESHADNAALNSSQGMLPFARTTFVVEE